MKIQKVNALFFLLVLFSLPSMAQQFLIQHLEPMNWWVGMKHPKLQLMVHGEDISLLQPFIDYPGVTLVNVEKTNNKNYLFVNLHIADNTRAGSFTILFKQGDKTRTKMNYRLDERMKNSADRKSFSASDSVYLIVPDRFSNGDANNDSKDNLAEKLNRGSSGGRHGGDIKGIRDNLDYISDMGFTMIWPTPLLENNQEIFSYHGYSTTDHYKIDGRFGTNSSYKDLVAAANKKGLGVIQDIVLNHIGSGHWWMRDMPAEDWINNLKNYTETSHKRTTVHDPHAAPEDMRLFTDGWFVKTMPDLNQRNPLLATYLIQNSVWWIEYANLSGIREDTYGYSDKNFLAAWGKYILEEYPNFNIVGEEWSSNTAIVASWQKGFKNYDGYQSYLPSVMDFPAHEALRNALIEEEGQNNGFNKLYETIANDFLYPEPSNLMVFTDNHDTSRIFSALNDSLHLYKNAIVFIATTRGIPQFFYGTEVLFRSPKERDDGAVRADMLGGWPKDKASAFTGLGLSPEQIQAQQFVKRIFNWRKENEAIKSGKLMHYAPEKSTYVYFRHTESKKVMVVLNKNAQDTQLDLARFQGMLKGHARGFDLLNNKTLDLTSTLSLKAMTPMIIQL